jgi:hypothetical protein
MVKVLPEPVGPYANTVPLNPLVLELITDFTYSNTGAIEFTPGVLE